MKCSCGSVLPSTQRIQQDPIRTMYIYIVVIYDTCQKRNISHTVHNFTPAQIIAILDHMWYLFTLQ